MIDEKKLIEELESKLKSPEHKVWNEVVNMTIRLVNKQPPADQCVPLSEVYRVIAGHSDYHGDNILAALTCIAEGKEVKPVKPLPADQWIPCSERLPNDEQKTFITAQLQGGDKFTSHATYHAEKPVYWPSSNWVGAGFYSYDSEYGECKYENVIAWMPAEPYKGE